MVDRFSGWPIIYHYPSTTPTSEKLINNLRTLFCTYGAPEYLFSDGGPQFKAKSLESFLQNWKITHNRSSAKYPQSNGRAELSVKTAKRILEENTAPDGSLNSDKACRALLQYRNTPLRHLGLSPAQIMFHRNLRDCMPTKPSDLHPHKRWIKAAEQRERDFFKRNQQMIARYNQTAHALPPLTVGSTVLIHDGTGRYRWNRAGIIVQVEGRSYSIRMHGSGRIVSRNRRFIKPSHARPDSGLLLQTPLPQLPLSRLDQQTLAKP